MQLVDLLMLELSDGADIVPHDELGHRAVYVNGLVDVGALAALAYNYAADVVDATRWLGTTAHPGQVASPMDSARELRHQAKGFRTEYPDGLQ